MIFKTSTRLIDSGSRLLEGTDPYHKALNPAQKGEEIFENKGNILILDSISVYCNYCFRVPSFYRGIERISG